VAFNTRKRERHVQQQPYNLTVGLKTKHIWTTSPSRTHSACCTFLPCQLLRVPCCIVRAGKCSGSVLADAACVIQANSLASGRLDLCTVEGVAAGSYNLPDVFTGAGTDIPNYCRMAHLSTEPA
jgi:hypothetical protein